MVYDTFLVCFFWVYLRGFALLLSRWGSYDYFCLLYIYFALIRNMWIFYVKLLFTLDVCFSWLFVCLPLESLCVLMIVKLTNQVPEFWERVKVCFAGIFKSGFTTNLCIKLISSWEILFSVYYLFKGIVTPNPFPIHLGMYACNLFPFYFMWKGLKCHEIRLMCKLGLNCKIWKLLGGNCHLDVNKEITQ